MTRILKTARYESAALQVAGMDPPFHCCHIVTDFLLILVGQFYRLELLDRYLQ